MGEDGFRMQRVGLKKGVADACEYLLTQTFYSIAINIETHFIMLFSVDASIHSLP